MVDINFVKPPHTHTPPNVNFCQLFTDPPPPPPSALTSFMNSPLVVFVDMVAMAIENESKNEDLDLDLYSVRHNDRDKGGTGKKEEARQALKT